MLDWAQRIIDAIRGLEDRVRDASVLVPQPTTAAVTAAPARGTSSPPLFDCDSADKEVCDIDLHCYEEVGGPMGAEDQVYPTDSQSQLAPRSAPVSPPPAPPDYAVDRDEYITPAKNDPPWMRWLQPASMQCHYMRTKYSRDQYFPHATRYRNNLFQLLRMRTPDTNVEGHVDAAFRDYNALSERLSGTLTPLQTVYSATQALQRLVELDNMSTVPPVMSAEMKHARTWWRKTIVILLHLSRSTYKQRRLLANHVMEHELAVPRNASARAAIPFHPFQGATFKASPAETPSVRASRKPGKPEASNSAAARRNRRDESGPSMSEQVIDLRGSAHHRSQRM